MYLRKIFYHDSSPPRSSVQHVLFLLRFTARSEPRIILHDAMRISPFTSQEACECAPRDSRVSLQTLPIC